MLQPATSEEVVTFGSNTWSITKSQEDVHNFSFSVKVHILNSCRIYVMALLIINLILEFLTVVLSKLEMDRRVANKGYYSSIL